LKIEIPLKFNKSSSSEGDSDGNGEAEEQQNEDDKYLELVFDLKDFSYEDVEFYKNREAKNVLVVKATKRVAGEPKRFTRKYVLPGKLNRKNFYLIELVKKEKILMTYVLIASFLKVFQIIS